MKLVYISPVTKVLFLKPSTFFCASDREIDNEDPNGPGGNQYPVGDNDDDDDGSLIKRNNVWDF